MTEVLVKLFGAKRADLTRVLEKKGGFDADEAEKFLAAVLEQLRTVFLGGQLDLSRLADLARIRGKLDPAALAKLAGVDERKATKGLDHVLDKIKDLLGKEAGSVSGMKGKRGRLFGK